MPLMVRCDKRFEVTVLHCSFLIILGIQWFGGTGNCTADGGSETLGTAGTDKLFGLADSLRDLCLVVPSALVTIELTIDAGAALVVTGELGADTGDLSCAGGRCLAKGDLVSVLVVTGDVVWRFRLPGLWGVTT